ncbi:MAG: choice-of-anchor B family protein [Balneolaceae bacterium]
MLHLKRLFTLIVILSSTGTAIAQSMAYSSQSEPVVGFSRALDISAETIFIGEPENIHQPGVVYIYNRNENDWSESTRVSASDGFIGDEFGRSISADDNTVLIGSPAQLNGTGAAYLFDRASDGSWSESAKLTLSETEEEIGFGAVVALHGRYAFVSAPNAEDGLGAIYLFERGNNGSWELSTTVQNPDENRGSAFGSTLAVDGSRLAVGAPQLESGAVYIFNQNDGEWELEATLDENQISDNARYGSSIALNGTELLVGAPNEATGTGAVLTYRFDEESGSWSSESRLQAFDGNLRQLFGSTIAFSGNEVWAGAPNAEGNRGKLYTFTRSMDSSIWSESEKLPRPEVSAGDRYAGTLAIDGDVAVVGLIGAYYGSGAAAVLERNEDDSWEYTSTILGEGINLLEPITGSRVNCTDGYADIFDCEKMDLISFLPVRMVSDDRGVRLNDIWGWTDPETGDEYAIIGRNEGTSFVDLSDPYNPVYLGNLPMPEGSRSAVWRDMKVYKNHVFIVADAAGPHGVQIMDLTKLRDYDGTPKIFEVDAHYRNINSAHNIVLNEDSGHAFVVGASAGGTTCGGGLHMINIEEPTEPEFVGCFADPSTGRSGTGYSHDAQCVIYDGPQEEFAGREICIGANETAISLADVTDKENPVALSTASYPDYGYIHQGWLSDDHRYFFQNDELDELQGTVDQTRTIIWDLADLRDPQFVQGYLLDSPASDHNLYIRGDMMYQSNYTSGLRVIDITDPENPTEHGYFDTHPFGEVTAGFSGTWSNYPFFESGNIIVNSSREGFFILRHSEE